MRVPFSRADGVHRAAKPLAAVLVASGMIVPMAVITAPSATAAAGCSTTTPALGASMSCSAAGTDSITIPAGANSLAFTVIGGGGGAGIGPTASAGDGGNGAVVTGTLDVSGLGSTVDVTVGTGGVTGSSNYAGGLGGGYSALLTGGAPQVVAGGGGGGGGSIGSPGSGSGGNAGAGTAAGSDGGTLAASSNFAYGGAGTTGSGSGGAGGGFVDTYNPSPPNPPNTYNAQGVSGQSFAAGGSPTARALATQGATSYTSGGGGGGYGSGGSGGLNTSIGTGGGGGGGSFVSSAVSGATFTTQNDGGNQYCYYASCPAGFRGIHGRFNLYSGYNAVAGKVTLTFTQVLTAPVLVNETPPLTASTSAAYSGYTFTANGAPSPTFAVDTGSLPPGLSLNSTTGVLSGTATSAGSYPFTVRASNSQGSDSTVPIVIVVTAPAAPAPAGPSPQDLTSTGAGSGPQHVSVSTSAGEVVSLVEAGQAVSTVSIAGVGTYTLDAMTKVITFTPVTGYLGTTAGVSFRVTDTIGQSGTARYTPTVTKPTAPSPQPLTSTGPGIQHATITHKDGETLTLLDSAGTPTSSAVTIRGEGTYVLDTTTGVITFTPAAGFAGTGTGVGFQVTDEYGQTGLAAYAPTVAETTPAPTPKPSPTPVLKPLPKIDRSDLAKIPANPKAVTGTKRKTKAFNSSFAGVDAYPIVKLSTRRLKKGQATTLSGDGLFDFDSAKLTKNGRAQVKAVVFNLKGSKSVKCEGYTDYAGVRSHEVDLSTSRAKAVCTTLKMYGAKVSTKTRGYGPQRPVVVGGSAKGRKENRRVVIVVTK